MTAMPDQNLPFDRPLGVALIGCGRISPMHLKAIAQQPDYARLIATVDPNPARAAAVATQFDALHSFTTLEEALGVDEVEAVILCTPNALHASQAATALAAGRHVLAEKPFAETLADAQANADLAEKTGLVLAVGHTFRHVEAVRTLQDRLASFGKLRALTVSMCVFWDGPQAPWWATRTHDEGLILTLFAPHAIDFLQLVMGDADPVRVHVEAARQQPGWIAEDEAMILLRYPDDVLATMHLSYNTRQTLNRKTLFFDKTTVRIENGDELWIDDEPVVMPHRLDTDDTSLFNDGITHFFATQLREFALAVRGHSNRSVLHPAALRQTRLNRAIVDAARHQ
jgi:predicted dehydrogenase